jgi:hypothetical protein
MNSDRARTGTGIRMRTRTGSDRQIETRKSRDRARERDRVERYRDMDKKPERQAKDKVARKLEEEDSKMSAKKALRGTEGPEKVVRTVKDKSRTTGVEDLKG